MDFKTTVRKKKYDDLLSERRNQYAAAAKHFILDLIRDSDYAKLLGRVCGNYDRRSYLEFIEAIKSSISVTISPNPYGDLFCLRVILKSRSLRQNLDHKLSSNIKSLLHKREDLDWLKDIMSKDSDVMMDLNIDWRDKKKGQPLHVMDGAEFIKFYQGAKLKHQYHGSDRPSHKNWFRSIMDENADAISQLVLGEIDNE